MSAETHRRAGPAHAACFILSVSDSRTSESDTTGKALETGLRKAGHDVVDRVMVKDEIAAIRAALERALADPKVDAILVDGGTGITKRDVTVEAVTPLLEKPLPGFGELFRSLSYASIGPAAMLSRAAAGTAQGKVVFVLPGSPEAVDLALTRLILPELPHLLHEARR